LQRARINFFVDAFVSKVLGNLIGSMRAGSEGEREEKGAQLVESVAKELEPLLKDANPFFGRSERLTLAEVQTGSFVLRLLSLPKHSLLPMNTLTELEAKAPAFMKWANAVVAEKSVNFIWDEKLVAEMTKAKIAKMAAEKKL